MSANAQQISAAAAWACCGRSLRHETVRRLQQQRLRVRSIQIVPDGEYFMNDRGRLSNSLKDYTPAFSDSTDTADTEDRRTERVPLPGRERKAD